MVPSHHTGRIFSELSPLSFLTQTSCRAQKNNFFYRIKTSRWLWLWLYETFPRILFVCWRWLHKVYKVYHRYIYYSNYIDDIYENSITKPGPGAEKRNSLVTILRLSVLPGCSHHVHHVGEGDWATAHHDAVLQGLLEKEKRRKWENCLNLKRPVGSPLRLRCAPPQLGAGKLF